MKRISKNIKIALTVSALLLSSIPSYSNATFAPQRTDTRASTSRAPVPATTSRPGSQLPVMTTTPIYQTPPIYQPPVIMGTDTTMPTTTSRPGSPGGIGGMIINMPYPAPTPTPAPKPIPGPTTTSGGSGGGIYIPPAPRPIPGPSPTGGRGGVIGNIPNGPGGPGGPGSPGGGAACGGLPDLGGNVPSTAIALSSYTFTTPSGLSVNFAYRIAPLVAPDCTLASIGGNSIYASVGKFFGKIGSLFGIEAYAQTAPIGVIDITIGENQGPGSPGKTKWLVSGLHGVMLGNYGGTVYMVGFQTAPSLVSEELNSAIVENLLPSRINNCITAACPNSIFIKY